MKGDIGMANYTKMNSTKVPNPRRNSYAGTGCRHYTMHCLTLNSYQTPEGSGTEIPITESKRSVGKHIIATLSDPIWIAIYYRGRETKATNCHFLH